MFKQVLCKEMWEWCWCRTLNFLCFVILSDIYDWNCKDLFVAVVFDVRKFWKCMSPGSLMCVLSCSVTKIASCIIFSKIITFKNICFDHIFSNIWFNTLYIGFMFRIASIFFNLFISYMLLNMFSFPFSGFNTDHSGSWGCTFCYESYLGALESLRFILLCVWMLCCMYSVSLLFLTLKTSKCAGNFIACSFVWLSAIWAYI